MTSATATIRNHPNYNPDDFAYLHAKGYSEAEILAIWDRDRAWGHGPCRWDGHISRAKLVSTVGPQRMKPGAV